MKPSVIISFDVECSMGGAWANPKLEPVSPEKGMMGKFNNKYLGVPLICKILEKNNIKASFFIEPFNEELGYKGETEKVCSYLVNKDQDICLHIHPNHYHYKLFKKNQPFKFSDQIAELSEKEQIFLINEGAKRLEKWTGKRPIAFRAGNMGASEETLELLLNAGIWIDSSYTFPFAGGQSLFKEKNQFNGSKWYNNVLETALSGFIQPDLPGLKKSKPLDLMGISFKECKSAIQKICDSGADAVIILHSFSLFKVKDKQYSDAKINYIVKKRFENLCSWLDKERVKYPCITFSELGENIEKSGYKPKYIPPCKIDSPFRAYLRKVIQLANNFYGI